MHHEAYRDTPEAALAAATRRAQPASDAVIVPRLRRTVTLLMLGRLTRGGTDTICRIRNISSGGMRIDTASPLAKGETVSVEARSGMSVQGRVAWSNGLAAGIAFARTLEHEALVAQPEGPSGTRVTARSPRFSASATASLTLGGRRYSTRLDNISLGGCRVESESDFPCGGEGYLALPGLDPLACTSRWARGNRAGLSFVTRPEFARFARWLESPEFRFSAPSASPDAPIEAPPSGRMRFSRPRSS